VDEQPEDVFFAVGHLVTPRQLHPAGNSAVVAGAGQIISSGFPGQTCIVPVVCRHFRMAQVSGHLTDEIEHVHGEPPGGGGVFVLHETVKNFFVGGIDHNFGSHFFIQQA